MEENHKRPSQAKFCSCFSLKTRGVILGCIGVFFSFLGLAKVIIEVLNVNVEVRRILKNWDRNDLENWDRNDLENWDRNEVEADAMINFHQIRFGIYFAIFLVAMVSSSLLIVGSVRRNRCLLLPWLISGAVNILVGFTYNMVLVTGTMLHSVREGLSVLFIVLISYTLYLCIWLVVMSMFHELRQEENTGVGAAAIIYKAPPAKDGLPASPA